MRFPIFLGPRRSFLLTTYVLGLGLLCLATAYALPHSLLWRTLWGILILLLLLQCAWRLWHPYPGIRLLADGSVELLEPAATVSAEMASCLPCQVQPGTSIHPWLVVLRLIETNGRKHVILIAKDSLSSAEMRQLRIFLNWCIDPKRQVVKGMDHPL